MTNLHDKLDGRWSALGYGSIVFIVTLLMACSSKRPTPVASRPSATSSKTCGPTRSNVLGTWLPPAVYKETKMGQRSHDNAWRVSMWLPGFHADSKGHCHFSCATDVPLSMVLTADGPATFVLLSHRSSGSRRLRLDHATLTAPGALPLRQTKTRELHRGIPQYRVRFGFGVYLFSFPPLNPAWDQLELRVPFEGKAASLLVRFKRKSLPFKPKSIH